MVRPRPRESQRHPRADLQVEIFMAVSPGPADGGPAWSPCRSGGSAAEFTDHLLALGDALLLDAAGDLAGLIVLAGQDGGHELGSSRVFLKAFQLSAPVLELGFLAGGRLELGQRAR
jgi:hypothetical protein